MCKKCKCKICFSISFPTGDFKNQYQLGFINKEKYVRICVFHSFLYYIYMYMLQVFVRVCVFFLTRHEFTLIAWFSILFSITRYFPSSFPNLSMLWFPSLKNTVELLRSHWKLAPDFQSILYVLDISTRYRFLYVDKYFLKWEHIFLWDDWMSRLVLNIRNR